MPNRKAVIDDGMCPNLVKDADFDGYLGIPVIKKPSKFIIPNGITPFSQMNKIKSINEAIAFYEMDTVFSDVLINPERYVDIFKGKIIISPDCSLYRDAPLAVQIANVYRNRAIGSYYQQNGAYVIPQIRWGNVLTYSKTVLPEAVSFLGAEKHSIVAVGTYGCCRSKEDKYHFKAGLAAMLKTLEPEIVLVYGAMSPKIFAEFEKAAKFIQYPDWITRNHGGDH